MDPSQIDTIGLSHLNYAFASIDPTSFTVNPTNPEDVSLYPQFTTLKSAVMETWISVGGGGFSVPGSTFTTWSDMASNKMNRCAFIDSLMAFMDKWGFQGADLDWEYPAVASHGGRPEDTVNYVLLVQEMRAAFGTKYGISVVMQVLAQYF